MKIVPKGAGAPGSTARPFTDQPLLPADMMTMLNRANSYSSSTSWLIMVDRQACRLGVFRGQRGSWSYAQYWTCSTGAPSTPTPTGEYTVTGKGYSFGHGYTATTTRSFTVTICSIQYRTTRELLIPWTAEWECMFHKAACVCPLIALNGFGITCPLLPRW